MRGQGTSLVVQRLRLGAPNAGAQVQSGSGIQILYAATKTQSSQVNKLIP